MISFDTYYFAVAKLCWFLEYSYNFSLDELT